MRLRPDPRLLVLLPLLAPAITGAAGPGESAAPAAVSKLEREGPFDSRVRLEVTNRVRGEFWSFFATSPTGPTPNDRYNFLGNKLQLGLRVNREPFEFFLMLQDSLVWPAPADAPGAGGQYYVNTQRRLQEEPIFRQGWFRYRDVFTVTGLSTVLGRQLYRDGLEVPARDPTLRWVQKFRIAERLVGPFDYTHVGRSFDGAQLAYDTPLVNLTGFTFVPTAGGYEINANQEISSIFLSGLAVTAKESPRLPGTLARVFWTYYDDHRPIAPLDNDPGPPVRMSDEPLLLHTVGAQVAHARAAGPGTADVLLWAAGQLGSWQRLEHRAWDFVVEAGYQLPRAWTAPWLRAGIDSGSGDGDPDDGTHGTFFQLLPTARMYAQFPFYNMMNNRDVFAQLLLRPHRILGLRTDFHWLRVNAPEDLLYSGGGATSQHNFGYGGTPTGGVSEIGYLADVSLSFTPVGWLTLYAYYGHVFGQGVIDQADLGSDADYGYLEATVSF
jgi:hypothetical protein